MILLLNDICQYEGKYAVLNKIYANFWDHSPSALSGKNSYAAGHIQNDATLRSGFFRKTRSVTVQRFGFFPGFTDKE